MNTTLQPDFLTSKMKPPFKKLSFILFLTGVSILLTLPSTVPLKVDFSLLTKYFGKEVKIDTVLVRSPIMFNVGDFVFYRDLELALGLDLAGGSHLAFEADVSKIPAEDVSSALEGTRRAIERRVNIFGVAESTVQTSRVGQSHRLIVELPGVKETRNAIEIIGKTAQLDFRELVDKEATVSGTPITLANTQSTGFTGADFKRARPGFDQTSSEPVVFFETKEESRQKFGDITSRLVGKPLAIFLDETPISAPLVNTPITEGSGQINGSFTTEETRVLSSLLNSGALPIPVKLIEQRTVEASLGAESVKASVIAGIVGLAMVVFFMVLAYGRLGLLASIALVIYGILSLAIYKLVPIVLTLPGVAGFILSVGMAVDSNILIFERMKEETAAGKRWQDALEIAFGRAWDSIRDANIATLVTVFVLFNPLNLEFLHTSGPVRGFALTLGLGIAMSLFTGIFVTRTLLRVFGRKANN